MIPGFTQTFVPCGDVQLSVHRAGRGAPLILLHGYPQNHHCWENVAPVFAEHFDVIVPDLRGYGDSDAPSDDNDHNVYSKRQMAADIVALMDSLEIAKANLLGHDRGARVAYRFALDHPDRLDRLGIIEIVPTGDFWASWDANLAMKGYHWTFLAQPSPLPERMIGADPEGYVDWTLASWTGDKTLNAFSTTALASYRKQATDPARVHAMCADYRAGATIDKALDEADRATGRKITSPFQYLWAKGGFPAQTGDPAKVWTFWVDQMSDSSCISGHFPMEENPTAVIDTFLPFFRQR